MRRHHVVAATALAAVAPTTAAHAAAPSPKLYKAYQAAYDKAPHPGRNILKLGIRQPGPNRPATARELRRSLRVLRRSAAARASAAPAGGGSVASPALEAIAACESGGDPTAVDASGTYRGKYQFDLQTWQSVGGTGDPAAAPEAEQDRRAAALMAQAGNSPWPVCGA